MDEKGCQLGGGRKKACTKYLYGWQSHEAYHVWDANLELATIVECMSADGHALKPYIIFKGKQVREEWFHSSGALRASK